MSTKLKGKINLALASHELHAKKIELQKDYEYHVVNVKKLQKACIPLVKDTQLALSVSKAKYLLEKGDMDEACTVMQLAQVVDNAKVVEVEDSQFLGNLEAECFGTGEAEVAEFDGTNPFLRHVLDVYGDVEEIVLAFMKVFVQNDHVHTLVEHGTDARFDMQKLCTSFNAAFTDAALNSIPAISVRVAITEIRSCLRAFGALLDPIPFACHSTYEDMESLQFEGQESESPASTFTALVIDSEYYQSLFTEYRRAAFEEASHGMTFNSLLKELGPGQLLTGDNFVTSLMRS